MTPPHRLYLAGPMTGLPDLNRPAFAAAAERLAAAGFDVVNPAAAGSDMEGWGWVQYLRRAIGQLVTCDAVALLPGWEHSAGVAVEVMVADKTEMPAQTLAFWLDRGPGDGRDTTGVPTYKEHR